MSNSRVQKTMTLVDVNKGVKDGKPYHAVKLGDPVKCESASFFLRENSPIKTDHMTTGQNVVATLELDIYQGRMGVRLVDLQAAAK